MANNIAFTPMGMTYKANATTTSQVLTISAVSPSNQYRLASHQPTGNTGFPVYVNISTSANVTVSAPGNGSPSNCTVIPPGTVSVVTGPQVSPTSNVYVAFITDTGYTGAVEAYITPGEGL
jgi:hypothetical protein